jgi:hypothetical protein
MGKAAANMHCAGGGYVEYIIIYTTANDSQANMRVDANLKQNILYYREIQMCVPNSELLMAINMAEHQKLSQNEIALFTNNSYPV